MFRFVPHIEKSRSRNENRNLKSKHNKHSKRHINFLGTIDPEHQNESSQMTGPVSSHSDTSLLETYTPPSTPKSGSQCRITTENTSIPTQDNLNEPKQPTETDKDNTRIKQGGFGENTINSQRHPGISPPSLTNAAENEPTGIQEMGTSGTSGDFPSGGNQIQDNSSPANFSMDTSTYRTDGKGLCIIMANFIPDKLRKTEKLPVLPGYKRDIESLTNLFESETFDFDVITELNGLPFRNLSSQGFRKALYNIQQLFKDREQSRQPRYDKFLMFVLSHGGEGGIHMCEEGSEGRQEEIHNNEVCVITQEEIINSFTHDRVASLKGIPKCFFFQACRGSELTHAAAEPYPEYKPDDEEECNSDLKSDEKESLPLPSVTRKNILVAYASLDMKKSYVHSETGSWFIENLVSVLKKQSEHKNIFEMLTEMTALTSTKTKHERFVCNSKNCVIKVNWENQLCPVTVIGKVNHERSNGTDEQHTYRPVFVSPRNTYIGFAQAEDFPLNLTEFRGTISFLQYKGKQLEFDDWVPAQHLNVFENENHFKIDGQLKIQHVETKKGILKIDGDKLKAEPIRQKGKIEKVEVEVKHGEKREKVSDPKQLKEAFVYISDRLYGSGPLKQDKDGVWGVEVEMYQLPVFTSTLTKQLYLAKLNKRQDEDRIFEKAVEEKSKCMALKEFENFLYSKAKQDTPGSSMDINTVDQTNE